MGYCFKLTNWVSARKGDKGDKGSQMEECVLLLTDHDTR